jgi:hypothetical protein
MLVPRFRIRITLMRLQIQVFTEMRIWIWILLQIDGVSLGFFYCELSAAGGHNWLPAPLGWKLANARNTVTVENNRNWAELLLHDVYFTRSKDPQIHNNHGCKTTISWFSRTCNESKTTLYYWLYTMTLCNLQIH